MRGLLVNGRRRFFQHLSNLTRVAKARWTVERNGITYEIEGGRHAGGTSRCWFVDSPNWTRPIPCTSLVDALRMLDTM